MSCVFNARERKALGKLSRHKGVLVNKQLPGGVGIATLAHLVELGPAEAAPSERYSDTMGWCITRDGWRSIYGKTHEEMIASGRWHRQLRVRQWPSCI